MWLIESITTSDVMVHLIQSEQQHAISYQGLRLSLVGAFPCRTAKIKSCVCPVTLTHMHMNDRVTAALTHLCLCLLLRLLLAGFSE